MGDDRSELRSNVIEFGYGRCEHPVLRLRIVPGRSTTETIGEPCGHPMKELAHIYPRGMGHTGYRDEPNNVFAACTLHARTSDNIGPRDVVAEAWAAVPGGDRFGLAEWIWTKRMRDGWNMPPLERDYV